MRLLSVLIPLLIAFDYKPSLNHWELNTKEVDAHKLSIRSKLENFKKQCDYQKQKRLFPISCFKLLKNMKLLNQAYDYKNIEASLDKRCRDTILKIVSIHQIKQISPSLVLGSGCEELFKKQKEIIKYKLEI